MAPAQIDRGALRLGRHRQVALPAFLAVTFAVSWIGTIPMLVESWSPGMLPPSLAPLQLLMLFGTGLTTIAVTWWNEGWAGVRSVLGRLATWRVGRGWYALALLAPAALFWSVLQTSRWLGYDVPQLPPASEVLAAFGAVFVGYLLLNTEEIAWRGYVLPRLLERHGPLQASLILGVVLTAFHVPLFALKGGHPAGYPFALFALMIVAITVIFTWLAQHTGASLLLAHLLHQSFNAWAEAIPFFPSVTGDTGPLIVAVGALSLGALIIAAHWLIRSADAPAETAPASISRVGARAPLGRPVRLLLAVLIVLGLLAAAGALYQAVATAHERSAFPPPGQLVDVGGYQLHVRCIGQGHPTVVLEAGSGAPADVWAWVQPALAEHTRVCAYDRAGLGWSDPSPRPRDARSVAEELRTLLANAGEHGPFVLAGHSLGGQYALAYAATFPEEVGGMVLVDAQHPDTFFRLPEAQAAYTQQALIMRALPVVSRVGLIRLLDVAPADARLPTEAQAALNRAKNTPATAETARDELLAIPENRRELRGISLGDLPLIVISATEHGTPELEWYTMGLQRELTGLARGGQHRVAAGADHSSLITDRAQAARTAEAILEVVAAARRSRSAL
jgi:pimeloyl-ACP methyl ester carboxylesterase/membrane protease YdiL (CAAX protease family)